jgi:hypothetical protein
MLLLAAKGKMIACSSKCILTYTAVDDNLDILRGDQDIVHQAARDLGKSFRCEDSVESFFSEREEADAEADMDARVLDTLVADEACLTRGGVVDPASFAPMCSESSDFNTMLEQARVILANDPAKMKEADTDPRFLRDGPVHQELVRLAVAQAQRPPDPLKHYSMSNGGVVHLFSVGPPGMGLQYMYQFLRAALLGPLPTLSGDGPTFFAPCLYDVWVPCPQSEGGLYNPLDHPLVLAAMQQRIIRQEASRKLKDRDFDFHLLAQVQPAPPVWTTPLTVDQMEWALDHIG